MTTNNRRKQDGIVEIFGAIAADAAGESMHKNKEKKKLEATKDNPEEHARVLEEIEKRKERNNKMALFPGRLIFAYFVFSGKSSPRHVIHHLDYVSMAKKQQGKNLTLYRILTQALELSLHQNAKH